MARIPLGNFGNVIAEGKRKADTSAVWGGVGQIGGAVTGLAVQARERDLALNKAKASNRHLGDEVTVLQIGEDIVRRVDSGKLQYEDARMDFDKQVGSLGAVDIQGLDEITAENAQHARKLLVQRHGQKIDAFMLARREQAGGEEWDGTVDRLAILSDHEPDLSSIDTKAVGLAELARQNGVDQVRIAGGLSKLRRVLGLTAATRDPAGVLEKLGQESSGDGILDSLDFAGRHDVQRQAEKQLVANWAQEILGVFSQNGQIAGTKALSGIAKSGMPADLVDDVRSKVIEGVSQLRTQRKLEHVDEIASVERQIAAGTAGGEAIDAVEDLFAATALSPAEYVGYQSQIERVARERVKDDDSLAAVAGILSAGLPVDPSNAEQMRGLDAAFRRDVGAAQPGDGNFQSVAKAYADVARVLPASVDSWLSSAARSPDADVVTSAAEFFGQLQDRASEAAAKVDSDTRAMLGLMSSMVKAGSKSQAAFETARANVFETRRDVVDLRRQALGEKKTREENDEAFGKLVNKHFQPTFSSKAAVPDALKADYDGSLAAYYAKTGNLPLARDLAWADIRKIWGRTEVNGRPEIMAYAPEAMVKGMTAEVIRADLRTLLEPLQIDADKVRLVQGPETVRSDGRIWNLVTTNRYGAPDVLRGADGLALRYPLPTDKEAMNRAKERMTRDEAEQQRKRRDVMKALADAGDDRAWDLLMLMPNPAEGIKTNEAADAVP